MSVIKNVFDEPDSEGWWWYRENIVNGTIPSKRPILCLQIFKPSFGTLSVILDDKVRFVKNLHGEWQKAIMPDWGKDECNKE